MEYNSEQLKQAILNYIADETYDYAIMINGLWGCGKSYFIREVLIDHFYSHSTKYVYVSLYGIDSLQEITKQVLTQNFFGNKKGNEIAGWASLGASIIFKQLEKNGIDTENVDRIAENLKNNFALKKDTVLIFDDLERTKIPINELLGYINRYVEHQHVKVIIVANEEEIDKKLDNAELKYLVAMNHPVYSSVNDCLNNETSNKELNLHIDKLEAIAKKIFEEKSSYHKIKEKLIGETYDYFPDLKVSCINIIDSLKQKESFSKELERLLRDNVSELSLIMENVNHKNFRTFQFFVSKMNNLAKKMDIKQQEVKEFFEEYLIFCFDECIKYKSGNTSSDEYTIVKSKLVRYINGKSCLTDGYLKSIMNEYRLSKSNKEADKVVNDFLCWSTSNSEEVKSNFTYIVKNYDNITSDVSTQLLISCAYLQKLHVLTYVDILMLVDKIKSVLEETSGNTLTISYMRNAIENIDADDELQDIYLSYILEIEQGCKDKKENPIELWMKDLPYSNILSEHPIDINYFENIENTKLVEKIIKTSTAESIWELSELFRELFVKGSFLWKERLNYKNNLIFLSTFRQSLNEQIHSNDELDPIIKNAINKLIIRLTALLEKNKISIQK